MRETPSFDVSLVFHVADGTVRGRLHKNLISLEHAEPLMDGAASTGETGESIRFRSQFTESRKDLFRLLTQRRSSARGSRLVVVSDALAIRDKHGGYVATPLVAVLRRAFATRTKDVLGLVALVPGRPHKTADIDVTASLRDSRLTALKKPIVRAANALWLKSPFRRCPTHEEGRAMEVHLVRSFGEMQECARLRFHVYDMLGYLDEHLSMCHSELELDGYDNHSLHLCAIDHRSGDIAGTLRIVLPGRRRLGTIDRSSDHSLDFRRAESLFDVLRIQGAWVDEMIMNESVLREKASQAAPLIPFPIMDNSDFGKRWPDFLKTYDYRHTGEISRLIVAPCYRGTGISTLLMRAALAASIDMGLRYLVLECIPLHIGMYKKHGFEPLPKSHCRSRDLDQIAVGMTLCLEEDANRSVATATAHRDLDVLRQGAAGGGVLLGNRGLCMCGLRECWSRAGYSHLGERKICPLASKWKRGRRRPGSS